MVIFLVKTCISYKVEGIGEIWNVTLIEIDYTFIPIPILNIINEIPEFDISYSKVLFIKLYSKFTSSKLKVLENIHQFRYFFVAISTDI